VRAALSYAAPVGRGSAHEDWMKKSALFAVALALAAMAVQPFGWLLTGKLVRWMHLEAALAIAVAVFVIISAVCWLIARWRKA
jgi:hypothetical protein